MHYKSVIIILTIFICNFVDRSAFASDPVSNKCTITPEFYAPEHMPKYFPKSSNLFRKAGSAIVPNVPPIYISGRLTDKNCVPVVNATVHIWQSDEYGLYAAEIADRPEMVALADPAFTSYGEATTDNLGFYHFITVMPGADTSHVPTIHMHVSHPDFPDAFFLMFFPEYNKQNTFITKHKLTREALTELTASRNVEQKGSITYTFNVGLEGINRYEQY